MIRFGTIFVSCAWLAYANIIAGHFCFVKSFESFDFDFLREIMHQTTAR